MFKTVAEENKKFWTLSDALVCQVTKMPSPIGACWDMWYSLGTRKYTFTRVITVDQVSGREHHSLAEEKPLFHRNDVRMRIYHFQIDYIAKVGGLARCIMVYVKMVNCALNWTNKTLKEAGFTDHLILGSFSEHFSVPAKIEASLCLERSRIIIRSRVKIGKLSIIKR